MWAFSYGRGTSVHRIVIKQMAGTRHKRLSLASSPKWHLRVIEGKRACRLFVEAGTGTLLEGSRSFTGHFAPDKVYGGIPCRFDVVCATCGKKTLVTKKLR